jgi:asparagine synthase (glutamine-hydrolysing)
VCGIAGLVCSSGACREEEHLATIRKMCDLQAHRGPDDRGAESLGKVALGAVRLSIIDLTAAGHMPMSDATGRWWITYNGEVYNFAAIREELEKAGHVFRSRTDTEVVLHAFIEWGEECVHRFIGMFAFAVYDRKSGAVTLVRDRFGVKPLYYTRQGGHIYFSSEMKALTGLGGCLRLNRRSLLEWFLYHNVDALTPETPIEEIEAVLPGQIMTIREGRLFPRVYYSPAERVREEEYRRFAGLGGAEAMREIEETLAGGTEARLVSDVPLGTLCSGGLDSSLITALAVRRSERITAFHVSVADRPDLDEKPYAEAVTRFLGIPLVSFPLTARAYRRSLVRAVYASDLPLAHANSVAFALISRVAREEGVTVLLSGEGADELFGGYSWRYRRYRALLRARRLLSLLPSRARAWIERAGYAAAGLPVTTIRFDELVPLTLALVDNDARNDWRRRCEEAYGFVGRSSDRAVLGAMLADLNDFLVPLLRRLDRMSMSASTECRVPFLDHRLVEKAIHMPLPYRVGRRADKWVLKRIALRHLPARVVMRRKAGFPLPIAEYLAPLARAELFRDGFCETEIGLGRRSLGELVDRARQNPFAFSCIVDLELWGRLIVHREPIEAVEEMLERLEPGAA